VGRFSVVKVAFVAVFLVGMLVLLGGSVMGLRRALQLGADRVRPMERGRRRAYWWAVAVPVPAVGIATTIGAVVEPTGSFISSVFLGAAVGVFLMLCIDVPLLMHVDQPVKSIRAARGRRERP
jgi:hypothetical protein